MSSQHVVVAGFVGPDGTLAVRDKVDLPPGPVYVTVQAAPSQPTGNSTLQVLREIWAERDSLGLTGRNKEEIDAEIDAMRNEDESPGSPLGTAGYTPASQPE
jgi:hypothetical protein